MPGTIDNIQDEVQNYINIGINGHHPLLFKEWIYELEQDTKGMDHYKAKKVFYNTYKKLAKHKNPDRKKMALCGLSTKERKDFIKAWMKLTEVGTLKSSSELH